MSSHCADVRNVKISNDRMRLVRFMFDQYRLRVYFVSFFLHKSTLLTRQILDGVPCCIVSQDSITFPSRLIGSAAWKTRIRRGRLGSKREIQFVSMEMMMRRE